VEYTNPFGGGVIEPTQVGYRSLTAGAIVQLSWPGYSETGSESSADKIDILSSAPGGSLVRMPPANVVSPGQAVLFTNLSANTVVVQTYFGTADIVGIVAGASVLVYLVDNTTQAGVWRTVLYGVGTGTLNAASAAGLGLEASGVTLRVAFKPVTEQSTSFSVNASMRASTQVWIGGVGGALLGAAATLGTGFVFLLRNQGTGTLTVFPNSPELVDGVASVALNPGDSCFLVCDGVGWYTVGRQVAQLFNFTLLSKAIAFGTTVLTLSEAANLVQKYTGALAGAAFVTLPSVVQVYYVTNATTGLFTTTFQTGSPGTTVALSPGETATLLCDGVNVINASSLLSGGATSGRYTPVLTGVANIGALSVITPWFWTRVGAVVRVSGAFLGTPTAATTVTQVGISLPVPSSLAASGELSGTGKQVTLAAGESIGIYADPVNDRANALFQSSGNTDAQYTVEFSYVIL